MTKLGSTELKVGVGVSIGLLLFVVTVLLLGGQKSLLSRSYTLKASFERIEGLQPGGVVSFSGFQIGNVKKIDLNPDGKGIVVTFKILSKYQKYITENSFAGLRTQGALGDKYIYITQGEEGAEPLKPGDFIKVESTSSDLLTTISQRGDELTKVFDILNEIHTFTKALNKNGRSDQLVENFTKASYHMGLAMEKLDLALQDVRGKDKKNLVRMSESLASITEKIDDGTGTLGALINDPTIYDKIKGFLGGSKRSDYMKSLIKKSQDDKK